MRILLVHNFYGSAAPSGENQAVLAERDLLRSAGHEVIEYFVSSDSVRDRGILPVLRTAATLPWNPFAYRRLRRLIRDRKPAIMHVHNTFPLLSPAIFRAAAGTPTAVVNTLHNYRTVCPNAIPMRGGQPCTLCLESRSVLPSLRYGCYRDSRLATLPLAACVSLHRAIHTYTRYVDAFIALTGFQKRLLVQAGLPEHKIHIKPNFFAGPARVIPWEEREPKVVFLGRVSREKGVDLLIDAWRHWGPQAPLLEIIGGGPELPLLRQTAASSGIGKIIFTGPLPREEAHQRLARARLLVMPSRWFEGFPMVLAEAFAFGVPVIAPDLGAFPELVAAPGVGALFTTGDSASLQSILSALWCDSQRAHAMAQAAAEQAAAHYSAAASRLLLESVYRLAASSPPPSACTLVQVAAKLEPAASPHKPCTRP